MMSLLRFITCGSVDDGKSTLIGRLLHDCGAVPEDQLTSLARDSERHGTTGRGNLDLALLVDGLSAEREQGITIDVAYRYFGTARRRFIVADTPGHEQYTRNMATGASNADLAVLLVDARKGLLTQTRRHSFILSLMGVRQVVLAVNKMDAIGWDQDRFNAIVADYRAFAAALGFTDIQPVPLSALTGDNVTRASAQTPWYTGVPLLGLLEAAPAASDASDGPFRFPVQWVVRPDGNFRGLAGTVAAGAIQPGAPVRVLPSGRDSTIARIVTQDGDRNRAAAGQAVTLVLTDDVDVTRGDMLVPPGAEPEVTDQFTAHLIWMHDEPLLPGRAYLIRMGTATATAQITQIKHRVDVNSLDHLASHALGLNDVGLCNLSLDRPLPAEPYADGRACGSFILIDRHSNATLACGMVLHGLRRAGNIQRQPMRVGKPDRVAANGHRSCVLWFTGLSGAGKSTIADLVEQRLHATGCRTMSLDGDNVRHGLCRDLGFTPADRVENIRRVAHVAQLMAEAGLIVLVSLISPFRTDREMARSLLPPGEFLEIFVDTPLDICEARDVKGLYRKARSGALPNFTGIGSPYEPPTEPDLRLDTGAGAAASLADAVVRHLAQTGIIPSME